MMLATKIKVVMAVIMAVIADLVIARMAGIRDGGLGTIVVLAKTIAVNAAVNRMFIMIKA